MSRKTRKNFEAVKPKVCGFCKYFHESADGSQWGCYIDESATIEFVAPTCVGGLLARTQYLRTCGSFDGVFEKKRL
jgi:hypothetical protein